MREGVNTKLREFRTEFITKTTMENHTAKLATHKEIDSLRAELMAQIDTTKNKMREFSNTERQISGTTKEIK